MNIAPRARREIHLKVKSLLSTITVAPGAKALDVPLGPGAMALELMERGYKVHGLDIDVAQSAHLPTSIERVIGTLNKPMPFSDGEFDLVTSLEGIEHVENHTLMLQEIGRVLKPGGHLILSTPNICNLEERLNFLVRGGFYRYIPREEFNKNGTGFDHQNLITYVEICQNLDWAGLQVLSTHADKFKWKQAFFLFPLTILLKLYALCQSEKRRRKYLLKQTASWPVLMGGNTVIVLARKGHDV
jgi:ubiquinone/menaquinone biosynthesis C-methylase UbiE